MNYEKAFKTLDNLYNSLYTKKGDLSIGRPIYVLFDI